MKKILPLLFLCLQHNFLSAQLPYIGTTTVIPQSPTSADIVKIVTHVYTPNQGILVDIGHTVSYAPKAINITTCYWQGMLTAIQNHVDTFLVGQLQPGTYTINHRTYLSTTQQHCSKIDSNMVMTTLTVSGVTGLKTQDREEATGVFPNPAKESLGIADAKKYSTAAIYSVDGRLIRSTELGRSKTVMVDDLQPGVYFIHLSANDKTVAYKFIKE